MNKWLPIEFCDLCLLITRKFVEYGIILKTSKSNSGGFRISLRGANLKRGAPTYYLAKFRPKLHENKKIGLSGGARLKFDYVDLTLSKSYGFRSNKWTYKILYLKGFPVQMFPQFIKNISFYFLHTHIYIRTYNCVPNLSMK